MQWAVVAKGDHYMEVICHFADGSKAKGCHVSIEFVNSYTSVTMNEQTVNISMVHSKHEGSTCVALEPATSPGMVKLYDWEEDGSIGHRAIEPFFERSSDTQCE